MLREVLDALAPEDGERFIDATFGAGGYTCAILDAADTTVVALDRDPTAVKAAFELTLAYQPRLSLVQAPFELLQTWAASPDAPWPGRVDGVVFDLGVSSMQLDRPERGFSFRHDGPLDMRMFAAPGIAPVEHGPTAADIVNTWPERRLADLIYRLGEERRSRAIARAIVAARTQAQFTHTLQLADVVARAVGGAHDQGRHPATRTFQALRIAVNDELGQLARGLAGAEALLKPGGRLVVVTFHSLEDRIVKRFIAERAKPPPSGSRHLPQIDQPPPPPSFRIVNSKPLTPSKGETDANPRARSARLRAAVRTEAPAWPLDLEGLDIPSIE
jgi:16S rRNA (cytosine1402-N4)-methyltransferase